jgi:hypothetical protein
MERVLGTVGRVIAAFTVTAIAQLSVGMMADPASAVPGDIALTDHLNDDSVPDLVATTNWTYYHYYIRVCDKARDGRAAHAYYRIEQSGTKYRLSDTLPDGVCVERHLSEPLEAVQLCAGADPCSLWHIAT